MLRGAAQRIETGDTRFTDIEHTASEELNQNGWRVDYVAIRSQASLQSPKPDEHDLVILAAAHLGRTRLIDNLECRLA
jgi:pantoate--beta-alanine ligase